MATKKSTKQTRKPFPVLFLEDGVKVAPTKAIFTKQQAERELQRLENFAEFWRQVIEICSQSMGQLVATDAQTTKRYREIAIETSHWRDWFENVQDTLSYCSFFEFVDDARNRAGEAAVAFGPTAIPPA